MKLPIVDLHCDLLTYMANIEAADIYNAESIGCSVPMLRKGNVALQTFAIFTVTEQGATIDAMRQAFYYQELMRDKVILNLDTEQKLVSNWHNGQIGGIAAIENASGFCEEDDHLDEAFAKLERLISICGRVLYIGLTHQLENRFGGGNFTNVGLKDDGKVLLQYLSGKKIAIDLAHTSDRLADDLLNYIDAQSLDIPILASHSNFRYILDNQRNLSNDLVKEVVRRQGVIGMNFVRNFVHQQQPQKLNEHILYGIEQAPEAICFGADFFFCKDEPDASRLPYYFPEHEDASCYASILKEVGTQLTDNQIKNLAYQNALRFIGRLWADAPSETQR